MISTNSSSAKNLAVVYARSLFEFVVIGLPVHSPVSNIVSLQVGLSKTPQSTNLV
jgi:hypothetical protein